jgi:HEPN domain-containing protein
MSGKTYAYLTGDGGTFSATMNSQGYATFSDIPVGTYKLSVFHKPQETGALNLDEYWGTENVQVNEGYNEKKFVRSAPWVTDYSVKVGGKEIARLGFMGQEAIDIGSTVDFQISVKNSGSSSVNTRVRLIIDANRISPFDYDQTSSWKTTSPGSTAIHQFTVSFVAGSQFHEIAPTYSAYIIVISKYDDKEYVTDQYIWTEFVSFKIQFSSEKANIIMKLASEIIDIVLKQDRVIVEETLRKIVQGKTVGDVSITISPDMIEKVSGRTGLVSGIAIPFTFKTAELAFIVLDKDMSYEKKLDALAEVVAKISVATATRIALHLAIKGMVTAAAITVPVPPASLTFTGAATVAALITYLGEGFISDAVADYVVSKNWGDIKGKARSFLEGFKESLFPILNKNAVSISAHCPIYISVRDTRGRITGMIFSNGRYSILEEIPGSKFFNESGHQTVWIAFPESGNYGIAVNGSDQGEYTIMVTSFVDSEVYRNETISGKIEKGEMNVLSIKLDDGVTPKIGPMIRSIFIDTTVAIGDPLTISLEVSGKGVIEVSAILRDSNNVSRSSILMKQGSIYRASLDTSGMEKGAAVLTLVAKDSNLSTAASFIVMLLGRMQIKIQQYKSEVSSGERLELKLLLTDHNDNPVDSADVHIILAGNNYVAQNTARGLYSAVLDTNQLEGSYMVYINASKPLYRSTETSLALMVRPWWWPYLPYSAIAFVAVILMIGYAVYRSRRREMIIIGSEDLLKVLKEASEHLSKGDYAEAVKYSAETLRSRLLEKLGLSGSLTIDELVDKVVKLRKDIDSEKLRYVLKKGEECTFARYKPNREEAEKVLKYSEELLSKL